MFCVSMFVCGCDCDSIDCSIVLVKCWCGCCVSVCDASASIVAFLKLMRDEWCRSEDEMGWDAGKGQTETKTKNKIKQNRKQQNIKNKHKRCYLNDAIFFAFCEFANIIRRSFGALYFCFALHFSSFSSSFQCQKWNHFCYVVKFIDILHIIYDKHVHNLILLLAPSLSSSQPHLLPPHALLSNASRLFFDCHNFFYSIFTSHLTFF